MVVDRKQGGNKIYYKLEEIDKDKQYVIQMAPRGYGELFFRIERLEKEVQKLKDYIKEKGDIDG